MNNILFYATGGLLSAMARRNRGLTENRTATRLDRGRGQEVADAELVGKVEYLDMDSRTATTRHRTDNGLTSICCASA